MLPVDLQLLLSRKQHANGLVRSLDVLKAIGLVEDVAVTLPVAGSGQHALELVDAGAVSVVREFHFVMDVVFGNGFL